MAISAISGYFQTGSGSASWMPVFIAPISKHLCAPGAAPAQVLANVQGARTSLRAWGCPYANGKRNCTGGPDAVGFPG